ncbi:MAG: hypothetical protein H0X73_00740 [Chthoniobacterales bacterium]|nr:hypothetical protein [Chthoniobacterales bacterium]
MNIEVARIEFELNLSAIFGFSGTRQIRDVEINGARVGIREEENRPRTSHDFKIPALDRLLPEKFRIANCEILFETGHTAIHARDLSLSASEVETGSVSVGELAIASPLFSNRFTGLRGATSWQNQRLTLGAITLARGIDIDAFTADFSHAGARRIGLELNVDIFGGKMRANVTSDSRDDRRLWDIAATASDISLAQMSEMLAWRERASGALQTCKFTFRGDPSNLARCTTSIWAEVSGLAWGERSAETIMFGASVYNRQLHLQQLYVKQRANQLTLSGDAPLTTRADDWADREVNANLAANIKDLDGFAQLFGARPGEYMGEIEIEGAIGIEDRKLRAAMNAAGEIQLLDARFPQQSRLTADISCNGPAATLRYAYLACNTAQLAVWGEMIYGDLRRFYATLFPMEHVADITSVPSGSCISGFALAASSADGTSQPDIEQIEVRGGLSQSDWRVSLRSRADGNAQENRIVRTFNLCPTNALNRELRLVGASSAGQ